MSAALAQEAMNRHPKPSEHIVRGQERNFFRVIREKHPRFADLPFFNDEADPISGWGKYLSWRPGPIYA